MGPVYVRQLEEGKQREVRKLLEGLLLHGCGGDRSEAERYYGMSFEEAVQNGMDSRIVDLDYLMVFCAEEYAPGKAGEQFRLLDAAVISSVLKEAKKRMLSRHLPVPADGRKIGCRKQRSGNGETGQVGGCRGVYGAADRVLLLPLLEWSVRLQLCKALPRRLRRGLEAVHGRPPCFRADGAVKAGIGL